VLAVGLYPFLVGDVLKIALAAILLPSGWKIIRHFRLDGTAGIR
jgi:biotin transporter BioY